jgi:hypothetical protein
VSLARGLADGAASGARASSPAPAGRRPVGRVPDFFLVGQPKSGTTALYEMLRSHPQIFMPQSKEPWYFAEELLERTPPRPGGTPRTLEEYLALFEGADSSQRAGEASALYLWSQSAPRRIAEVAPEARIIAILREPASLLRSLHLQFVETYVETESDLRCALELERSRREGRDLPRHTYWPSALMYSDHVRYVEQLRRYEQRFTRERMLVLVYDDFRSDNPATMRSVLRFLGVEEDFEIQPREANPSVQVRSQRLHELVHAISVGHGPVSRGLKASVKALTPARMRRSALSATQRHVVYADPEPADAALMGELRERFRDEVEALAAYLDRDLLAEWGYRDGAPSATAPRR